MMGIILWGDDVESQLDAATISFGRTLRSVLQSASVPANVPCPAVGGLDGLADCSVEHRSMWTP